ncbi:translation protein SH3-like domain-containing protein [Cladorrhinum sp. PSN259]|nr:translation protein SH3-like domain-containing protein [Cladorrhinum sp. PSN259]
MNVAPLVRRPLGCLKTSLHQARQQKLFTRQMATAVESSPSSPSSGLPPLNFHKVVDRRTHKLRTAFAVYPSTIAAATKISPPIPNPMPTIDEMQIKRMDPTGARTALFAKTRDAARVGDVLMVTHRRGGEPFAGVCLSIRRQGIDTAILLRNHLGKVGVEMWFKIYNKNVAGIEIVKRRKKRARRARLTYMRKPKHDMGSVEDLVFAWKKARRVYATGKGGAAKAGAKGAKGAKGKVAAKKK